MINLKTLITVAILVFYMILASQSLYSQEYGVLEDAVNKYKMEFPLDWKLLKKPHSKDLIKAEINKNNETGLQVRIYNNKNSFEKFVDWYVDDYIKQMTTHYKGSSMNIKKKGYSKHPLPKWYAVSMEFSQKPGKNYYVIQYLMPRKDQVFLFQAGCPSEEKESFEKVVTRMVKSVSFLK